MATRAILTGKNIFILGFLALILLLPITRPPAIAQVQNTVTQESTDQLTKEKAKKLISELNESEVEVLNKLLQVLVDNTAQEEIKAREHAGLIKSVKAIFTSFRTEIWNQITGFSQAVSAIFEVFVAIFAGKTLGQFFGFLGLTLAAILIGVAAEYLFRFISGRWLRKPKPEPPQCFSFRYLAISAIFNFAALAVFSAVAVIAADELISAKHDQELVFALILYVIFNVRMMMILLDFAVAPNEPEARMVSTGDASARFMYRAAMTITAIIVLSLFIGPMINIYGIEGGKAFGFWTGNLIIAGIIYATWKDRAGLASVIRGHDEHLTPGLKRMADWWPGFSIAIILLLYLMMVFGQATGLMNITMEIGITTITLIVFAPMIDTALRAVLNHIIPKMSGTGEVAEKAYYQTRNSYLRICRVVMITVIFLIIARMWSIDYQTLASKGLGTTIASRIGGFLFILAAGYLIWEAINLWINQRLARDVPDQGPGQDADSGEGGGTGLSRMASILPLVRMAVQAAIVVITVLLALGQLGINITPLLAGAGVFGLAIGFGAQALVKDIVSGVFFLWDDAFRLGEYIDIEGTVGTVEKISIRSLQLRHPNGPVHVVPYGEIPKLTNHSRDYVIMKLRFTVPFDTDIDLVRRLFKKIGKEMMEVPALADNFIKPFKSQGVADVDDVGIVIRGKFTTRPGAQWAVRKEVYSRVQKAFDENGIQFARREVRVQIPGRDGDEELKPEEKEAVSAAVAEAANNANQPAPVKKDDPH